MDLRYAWTRRTWVEYSGSGASDLIVWTNFRQTASSGPYLNWVSSVSSIPSRWFFLSLAHTRSFVCLLWLILNCPSVSSGPYPKFGLVHSYFLVRPRKNFQSVNFFEEVILRIAALISAKQIIWTDQSQEVQNWFQNNQKSVR